MRTHYQWLCTLGVPCRCLLPVLPVTAAVSHCDPVLWSQYGGGGSQKAFLVGGALI